MTFKEYIETFNKKKQKKKKHKKKAMDKLDNHNPGYLTYDKVIPTYPQVTQPAGGAFNGLVSGR